MGLLNLRGITSLRNLIFILIIVAEILLTVRVFGASFSDSVLIGGTGPANSKAQLDVKSTTKGVLLPRMTTTQQNAITSPTEGLIIYDNVLHELSIYDGSAWQAMFDAGNLTGSVPPGSVPAATTGATGVVFAKNATTHNFITGITSGTGAITVAQPAFTDISGNIATSQMNSGTSASSTTYWRGDGTWATVVATTPLTTLGDTLYEDATPTPARLAGNTSTTKKYLSQTGTGTISAVPAWAQIAFADISGTASLTTQVTGTLPIGNGGTGQTSATTALLALLPTQSIPTLGQPLQSNSVSGAFWGVLTVLGGGTGLATLTAHSIQVGNGTTAVTQLGVGSTGTVLTGVSTSDPAFSATPVLGSSGTIGMLGLSGNTSGVVTIKPQASAGTYNFNLPTSAGTAGDILTSAAGGSSPMTWTTVLPIANGGTNNAALGVTAGGVVYTDGSKLVNVGAGSTGQVLKSNGSSAPSWGAVAGSSFPVVVETLTSGTSFNLDYVFTVSSANATVGATYTNNGTTYTVYATIAAGTTLIASGSAAPLSSGTLTKASGTGDATITFSAANAPVRLHARLIGGGGGGGGSGTGSPVAGGAGGNTTFGTSQANGGSGGTTIGFGGAGGSGTVGSGHYGFGVAGSAGGSCEGSTTTLNTYGGTGGSSAIGGGGRGGQPGSGGSAAATNSGSGGGGAGGGAGGFACAGGGASGGYVDVYINSPSATTTYGIGAAGSTGTAGTSGGAGSAGAAGVVIVEESY